MTEVRDPRVALPVMFHNPSRLAILASLRPVQSADFSALRDAFDMTAAEMSRQLAILEREGLIEVLKSRRDRQTITQARLSPNGREAFERYLENLTRISKGMPT